LKKKHFSALLGDYITDFDGTIWDPFCFLLEQNCRRKFFFKTIIELEKRKPLMIYSIIDI